MEKENEGKGVNRGRLDRYKSKEVGKGIQRK